MLKTAGKNGDLVQERRAQIFEAAARVFARRGFHKATMQEIATEAGLGKGTLYEYVKSKKDLLFFVIDEGHQQLFRLVDDLIQESLSPEEKMRLAIRCQLDLLEQYRDAARSIIPEVEGLTERDKDRMEAFKMKYINHFKPIYEQGLEQNVFRDLDPFAATEIISNSCILWSKSDTLRERFPNVRDYEDYLVSLFMHGIAAG